MSTNWNGPQEEPMAEWEREILNDWDRENRKGPGIGSEHSNLVLGIAGLILILMGAVAVSLVVALVVVTFRVIL